MAKESRKEEQGMSSPAITRVKQKAGAKIKKLAHDLSAEIGRRAAKLSADERKQRHGQLLRIASRNR